MATEKALGPKWVKTLNGLLEFEFEMCAN